MDVGPRTAERLPLGVTFVCSVRGDWVLAGCEHLDAAAPDFTRDFGIAPRVRGAFHVGPVSGGEVGGRKRNIVFHGDVMNTTSRLEQLARELNQRLVVSGDAVSRLAGTDRYTLEDLGTHLLRGRTSSVQIYA